MVPLVFEATPTKPLVTPLVRLVQVMPSGEVRTVPLTPTATNCIPVHVTPSGEVKMSAKSPTTTNCDPVQVTPFCVKIGAERCVHCTPSLEVRMVLSPTATSVLPDHATAFSCPPGPCARAVQMPPPPPPPTPPPPPPPAGGGVLPPPPP